MAPSGGVMLRVVLQWAGAHLFQSAVASSVMRDATREVSPPFGLVRYTWERIRQTAWLKIIVALVSRACLWLAGGCDPCV